MAKIPFDIKYKPQVESGEYKVIDRFGYVLNLKDIINDVWYFSLRYPNTNYETERIYDHPENHLFIVTPEPELSEFEKAVVDYKYGGHDSSLFDPGYFDKARNEAAELLELAKKELVDDMQLRVDDEINEAYYRGKAEALKGLPRWRKWGNGACGNGSGIPIAIVKRCINDYQLVDALGIQGEQYIMLSDLEKLPGFKED